jgi:hypothetical protein
MRRSIAARSYPVRLLETLTHHVDADFATAFAAARYRVRPAT